jgi:hypothetical protein
MTHTLLALLSALCLVTTLGVSSTSAQEMRCAQPISTGESPTASDCLFILRVAVGSDTCPDPSCLCDTDGSGLTSATDALGCLKRAVGDISIDLICCGDTTTTSSTLLVATTTTTTTTTTTSTTLGSVEPQIRLTGGGCVETLVANGITWQVPGEMAGEKSEYQPFPGDMIGPFTWSTDSCGEEPVVDLVIPTVWQIGRLPECRYALNALNGTAGVVSILSEFGSPDCRPILISQ